MNKLHTYWKTTKVLHSKTILLAILFLLTSSNLHAQDYYWVGPNDNYNDPGDCGSWTDLHYWRLDDSISGPTPGIHPSLVTHNVFTNLSAGDSLMIPDNITVLDLNNFTWEGSGLFDCGTNLDLQFQGEFSWSGGGRWHGESFVTSTFKKSCVLSDSMKFRMTHSYAQFFFIPDTVGSYQFVPGPDDFYITSVTFQPKYPDTEYFILADLSTHYLFPKTGILHCDSSHIRLGYLGVYQYGSYNGIVFLEECTLDLSNGYGISFSGQIHGGNSKVILTDNGVIATGSDLTITFNEVIIEKTGTYTGASPAIFSFNDSIHINRLQSGSDISLPKSGLSVDSLIFTEAVKLELPVNNRYVSMPTSTISKAILTPPGCEEISFIKGSIAGKVDLVLGDDMNVENLALKDINVIAGSLTILEGEDRGNNTNVNFLTSPSFETYYWTDASRDHRWSNPENWS